MIFVLNIISKLISLYILAILVYALLSWLPGGYQSKLGQFLGKIIDPFQNLFNFATIGGVNFAPVLAIIVLELINKIIFGELF